MSRFVLEASVALAWCFPDQASDYTDGVQDYLRSAANEALVPPIWPYEVGNALAIAERQRRITGPKIDEYLGELRTLRIEVITGCVGRGLVGVLSLARSRVLSVYDASYLDLAAHESVPLATRDRALVQAAPLIGVDLLVSRRL